MNTHYIKEIKNGMSLLGTFNMIRYAKNSTILKLVHPNLEASLANESRNFIHDVIYMRKDSFKRICSKALSQRLLTELTEVENANVVIKSNVLPINNDFRIVPYAVLDCNFAERMSMDNPWKGTRYLLSPRRFLQNGYPRSWQQLKHINDKVVYGFDCIWRSNLEIVLKTEGYDNLYYTEDKKYSKIYIVTFETDSSNLDFIITDLNLRIKREVF